MTRHQDEVVKPYRNWLVTILIEIELDVLPLPLRCASVFCRFGVDQSIEHFIVVDEDNQLPGTLGVNASIETDRRLIVQNNVPTE